MLHKKCKVFTPAGIAAVMTMNFLLFTMTLPRSFVLKWWQLQTSIYNIYPQNIENRTAIWSNNVTSESVSEGNEITILSAPMFIVALSTQPRLWNKLCVYSWIMSKENEVSNTYLSSVSVYLDIIQNGILFSLKK